MKRVVRSAAAEAEGRYLILYRIGDNAIEIVRLVHAARDLDALNFGD